MLQDTASDPRFSDIGVLPSYFYPYAFDALHIRPFTVAEFKLLSRAAVTKDNAPLIKAVNLVIDQDAYDLTVGDFYYVLMWLKLHSFPKTPLTVSWTCVAPHNGAPCGKANAEVIHQSHLQIISLDEDAPPHLDDRLDYPRARLIPEITSALLDPELQLLVPTLQWVKQGATLEQKLQFVESQPDTELFEAANEANKRIVHGVQETVRLKCGKCGTAFDYTVNVEPHSFFRG